MAIFSKTDVVLCFSTDGSELYVIKLSNNTSTAFDVTRGVKLQVSSNDLIVTDGVSITKSSPYELDISTKWPDISFDPNENLALSTGIGVDMLDGSVVPNPGVNNTYASGTRIGAFYCYLDQDDLIIELHTNTLKFSAE